MYDTMQNNTDAPYRIERYLPFSSWRTLPQLRRVLTIPTPLLPNSMGSGGPDRQVHAEAATQASPVQGFPALGIWGFRTLNPKP